MSSGVSGNDLTSNIALFDLSSYPNQPNAGTISIAGVQVGDGRTATAALTISGSSLTIGSQGLTVASNAGSVSISTPVVLEVEILIFRAAITVGLTVSLSIKVETIPF